MDMVDPLVSMWILGPSPMDMVDPLVLVLEVAFVEDVRQRWHPHVEHDWTRKASEQEQQEGIS